MCFKKWYYSIFTKNRRTKNPETRSSCQKCMVMF